MFKKRQFEFLCLATKIVFLFDFCTDVLLNPNPSIIFTMREESKGACNFLFSC